MRKIAVIGMGYVGLVTAAGFADLGNRVVGVDIDENKIEKLRQGEMPFYEPGLEEMVCRNMDMGRLSFTTSYAEALDGAEFVFIAVGTPPGLNGEADLRYVESAARSIAEHMRHPLIIVNKSTVPVGTGDWVTEVVKKHQKEPIPFAVVSCPEFLREGSAIYDFMNPHRIVLGSTNREAAEKVAQQIRERAAAMLNARGEGPEVAPEEIHLEDRKALAPDGRFVTFEEIALNALHHENQEQIMATASYMSPVAPPPFAAQFAEVTVDVETGQVTVDRLLMVVDSGVIVNPVTASGQIEGGMTQALGYAVSEEMTFDERGRVREKGFWDYHIPQAHEMPKLEVAFVETFEPSHPFGVKAVAEIPMDGVAPAVANAIYDAVGVDIDDLPITPEKVWRKLREKESEGA